MATIAGAAANRLLDKVGTLTPGNNGLSNPYRPNFLGNCCHKATNTTAPEYVLRP